MEEECCGWDFLKWVGPVTSARVFRRLDHPADLVRAGAVSRSWRRFVVENDFSKSLCLRICPEVANFTRAVEVSRSPPPPPPPQPTAPAPESSHDAELKSRERDYRIYSYLSGALVSTKPSMDCILHCIGASSTDNFPDESMENTLEPQDRVTDWPSYWSSGGQDDPDVPESLTYMLKSDVCIIDEIRVHPFKAYFQHGHPIYSSKMVRIRMGHSKLPHWPESFVTDEDENQMVIDDDKNYVWTYTSLEFPMLQENVLQSFKLPRPVLCIGGVVKIELLGRVQKQATDDRYYICVCHAQVIGRSLSPVFMVDISAPAGYSILKYLPGAKNLCAEDAMQDDARDSLEWQSLVARYRHVATRQRITAWMNTAYVDVWGEQRPYDLESYGAYMEWYVPRTRARLTISPPECAEEVTQPTHHHESHRRTYDRHNASRLDEALQGALRVQSASDDALSSPDRTPAGYKKVLKHISTEMKKIVKNLSRGRSRNDAPRIGYEVGEPCSPAASPRPSESFT